MGKASIGSVFDAGLYPKAVGRPQIWSRTKMGRRVGFAIIKQTVTLVH
jgi:hypothetical protein